MDFTDPNLKEVCKVLANWPPYRSFRNECVMKKFGMSWSRCVRIINQLRPDWYPHHKESRYVLTRLVRDPEFEERYREMCRECLGGDVDDWVDHLKSEWAPKYPSFKKGEERGNATAWNVYTNPRRK